MKNRFFKFILQAPILTIIVLGILMFLLTQFLFIAFQNSLTPLAIEIIGSFIIIIVIEVYLFKVYLRAEYPETKTIIYNRMIGAMKNMSRDIVYHYFNLSKNTNDLIHDSKKLRIAFSEFNEANRNNIENIYIAISQTSIEQWSHKIDNYKKILIDYIDIAPLIIPKDIDLACVLEIKMRIINIQEELNKSIKTRIHNKKFFSSDLNFLVQTLANTIDSGFFDSIIFSNAELSYLERSN